MTPRQGERDTEPQRSALGFFSFDRSTFRLADHAAIFIFGDKETLFSERQQRLFDLNETAAFLLQRLRQGATFQALADDLAAHDVPRRDAIEWVGRFLVDWSQEDVVAVDFAASIGASAERQTVRVADTVATIAYADAAMRQSMGQVFRHLEVEDLDGHSASYIVVEGEGLVVIRGEDGTALVSEAGQGVPALKATLFQHVIAETEALAVFHTACLVRGGHALLIGGPSGAGKSTLTLALAAAGFGYAGDDVTLLDSTATLTGISFTATAKRGSWDLLSRHGLDLTDLPVHTRLDGIDVRYHLPAHVHCGGLPPRWLIMLRRQDGSRASLAKLEAHQALAALMEEGFSRTHRTSLECMRVLSQLISTMECYELCFSDLAEAVAVLSKLTSND